MPHRPRGSVQPDPGFPCSHWDSLLPEPWDRLSVGWPLAREWQKPFLHRELHFQRKAPAPSTGGASSSLRFKGGLEECRAFPAAIALSYSDTDDSSCWEQALFPSLCSALCTSQSLFTLCPSDSARHPSPAASSALQGSCPSPGQAG